MKKIAFINQRYGAEVNGGSEYYTKLMAEQLKNYYTVEVFTSKALTYDCWADYYEKDEEEIVGITVRRFGVMHKRKRIAQRVLKILITRFGCNTVAITRLWNKCLGPYVPDLVNYIKDHSTEYDAFIFVTYMYYPVVAGLPEVAEKAIFVPTAHDEYCIYFKVYKKLFRLPKKIVYLTQEERAFVQRTFHNDEVENEVIGIGITVPEDAEEGRFRRKHEIEGDYMLYAGRVDADKGCGEMFRMFEHYCHIDEKLTLVVVGKAYMEIPNHKRIRYLGFVSEQDKYDAMKGAKLFCLPSRFESLSIAVLEAMALGTPVLVNGECEVLKGHCERSGGGVWYCGMNSYIKKIKLIYENAQSMSEKAKKYVLENYSNDKVIKSWIKHISGN